MAPHLRQWEVMRWLRARGVEAYDLVAVPPAAELNPAHPLFGLYRFKSGFSERITEWVGTWDLPISRSRFAAWNTLAEACRAPVGVSRPARPAVLIKRPSARSFS